MIDTSECIEYDGYIAPSGYGQVGTRKYGTRYAHVVAWMKEYGYRPESLDLDHLCRNRACVNVKHLEPVTRAENLRRGISGRSKITREQAEEIRKLYATDKYYQQELADTYGVNQQTISKIINYDLWGEV